MTTTSPVHSLQLHTHRISALVSTISLCKDQHVSSVGNGTLFFSSYLLHKKNNIKLTSIPLIQLAFLQLGAYMHFLASYFVIMAFQILTEPHLMLPHVAFMWTFIKTCK